MIYMAKVDKLVTTRFVTSGNFFILFAVIWSQPQFSIKVRGITTSYKTMNLKLPSLFYYLRKYNQ